MTAITLLLPRPQEKAAWRGGACASTRAFVSMLCCTLNTAGTRNRSGAAPLCTDRGAKGSKRSSLVGRPCTRKRLSTASWHWARGGTFCSWWSCIQGQKANLLHSRDLGGNSSLDPKQGAEKRCVCASGERKSCSVNAALCSSPFPGPEPPPQLLASPLDTHPFG